MEQKTIFESDSVTGLLKPWQAYVVAITATLATLGLRLAIAGHMGGHQPTLMIFTVPIMLSAYVGGLRAGLLATLLSYLGAVYYLSPTNLSFPSTITAHRWNLFFVMVAGLVISVLNESLHRTRRRADAANIARKRAEEHCKQFFTLSQDVLCTLGFDGYFKDLNPAWEKTLGYSKAELLATSFIEFIHPDDRQATLAETEKVSDGKVQTAFENRYRCKDGSYRWFQWSATPVIEDRVIYGVARDITARQQVEEERKRFEEALQQTNTKLESAKSAAEKANLAKSDFLSSMSHELRTPLNAILGFAQLMESSSPSPTASQSKSIAQILQAGWYLLKLINEILDLTVIESGNASLSKEAVLLSELLNECASMMEPQAQQRGIRMTFPQFDNPVFVAADRTRLKQIIINLLSNAIKYNKEQGTVVLDCTVSASERIRISVKDSGAGLPPEKLARLFQPFNRLGKEDSSVAGTGIGLVVSKRLAELMGGNLGVESTVGVGSVFYCELGLAEAPQVAIRNGAPEALVQEETPAGTRRRTLLYVEDNPANMELVEELVARFQDVGLVTAVNGTLGIELARATQPQVIIMDINLPGISGIKALKILREDPATTHIPVIALSANAMPRDIERGLKAGFFRYLTKPIKIKEFTDTLHSALEFAEEQLVEAHAPGQLV